MMTFWVSTILLLRSSIIEGFKNDIHESRKTVNDAVKQAEEQAQYIRCDCLEIAGIALNEELINL